MFDNANLLVMRAPRAVSLATYFTPLRVIPRQNVAAGHLLHTCPIYLNSPLAHQCPAYIFRFQSTMSRKLSATKDTMMAAVVHGADGPEVLKLEGRPIPKPVPQTGTGMSLGSSLMISRRRSSTHSYQGVRLQRLPDVHPPRPLSCQLPSHPWHRGNRSR